VNGAIVETVDVDPALKQGELPLDVTYEWKIPKQGRDTFVVAEAGWPLDRDYPLGNEASLGDFSIVVPGYLPFGFTNAIWIDEDGDGKWTGLGPVTKN
jgi:hypothetical protein